MRGRTRCIHSSSGRFSVRPRWKCSFECWWPLTRPGTSSRSASSTTSSAVGGDRLRRLDGGDAVAFDQHVERAALERERVAEQRDGAAQQRAVGCHLRRGRSGSGPAHRSAPAQRGRGVDAVDQRHRHRRRRCRPAMPARPAPPRMTARASKRSAASRQASASSVRAPRGSAASCAPVGATVWMPASASARPSAPRQPFEHRPPALAAGHDGEAAVPRRRREGRLGQSADRHAGAFAQREQARDRRSSRSAPRRAARRARARGPGIEHRVLRHRVAGLAGDVGCAEARGDGVHLERRRRPAPARAAAAAG